MFVSRRTVRIEWGDCDPAGIVYYPRYVEYFDICTVALFEAVGYPKRQLLKDFEIAGFPMVDLHMRFLIPSVFGEDVQVETSIKEWKRSSFIVHHRLFKGEDLAVEGFETRVWTTHDPDNPGRLKSKTIPDELKAKFA